MTECPICEKQCESKYRVECDNSCGTITSQPCGCEFHHHKVNRSVVKGHNPDCGGDSE